MSMTAEEWYDKRDVLAKAFEVEPSQVPPGAVWFIVWPQPKPTDADIAWAREIAETHGLRNQHDSED